jgi:hypothetical protein
MASIAETITIKIRGPRRGRIANITRPARSSIIIEGKYSSILRLLLDFLYEVHLCEEVLPATQTHNPESIQNLLLRSLGYRGSIEVILLFGGVALELLELLLIESPLVGDHLSTVHAANRRKHSTGVSQKLSANFMWTLRTALKRRLRIPIYKQT